MKPTLIVEPADEEPFSIALNALQILCLAIFFLWGHLNYVKYKTLLNSIEELKQRITECCKRNRSCYVSFCEARISTTTLLLPRNFQFVTLSTFKINLLLIKISGTYVIEVFKFILFFFLNNHSKTGRRRPRWP